MAAGTSRSGASSSVRTTPNGSSRSCGLGDGVANEAAGLRCEPSGMLEQRALPEAGGRLEDHDAAGSAGEGRRRRARARRARSRARSGACRWCAHRAPRPASALSRHTATGCATPRSAISHPVLCDQPGSSRAAPRVVQLISASLGPAARARRAATIDRAAVPVAAAHQRGSGVGANPHRQQVGPSPDLDAPSRAASATARAAIRGPDHRAVAHRLDLPGAVLAAERGDRAAELPCHARRRLRRRIAR